jgi:hypothetical protein
MLRYGHEMKTAWDLLATAWDLLATAWGLLATGALWGCIGSGSSSWYRLHERQLPASEVVRVSGYVRFVDGRDLADRGRAFELLPGCHVIGTPEKWGESSLDAAIVATTGVVLFALVMEAGHHYEIDVRSEGMAGPVKTLRVEARETDDNGKLVGRFAPTQNQADIDACLGT